MELRPRDVGSRSRPACLRASGFKAINNAKRVSLHPVHVLACVLLLQILREASINVFDKTGKTDGTNN